MHMMKIRVGKGHMFTVPLTSLVCKDLEDHKNLIFAPVTPITQAPFHFIMVLLRFVTSRLALLLNLSH